MRKLIKHLERLFIPNAKNEWKPHIFKPKNLFRLAVVLLIIKFLIFSLIFYFPRTSHFAVVVSSDLVELANKERMASGLKPLVINQQLVQAAQSKAEDMLNQDYFAHTSPVGVTPWYWLEKAGYKYTAAGENLARNFTDSNYVHQAWMDSASHKANILNKNYQEIGIAVVEGELNGEKTVLAVEFFGKAAKPAAEKETKPAPVVAVSDTKIEVKPIVSETQPFIKGEEVSLKGPDVFKERGILREIIEEPKNIIGTITEKSEPVAQEIYIIILGLISLVLMLSIFINIKVQYPKMIFTVVIFLILVKPLPYSMAKPFLIKP